VQARLTAAASVLAHAHEIDDIAQRLSTAEWAIFGWLLHSDSPVPERALTDHSVADNDLSHAVDRLVDACRADIDEVNVLSAAAGSVRIEEVDDTS